jgi:hypothetical protein
MRPHVHQPYDSYRDPRFAWGYWMTIDAIGDPERPLIDENGRRWSTLREALWVDRLGMGGDRFGHHAEEQVEFLLTVLATMHRAPPAVHEQVVDVFKGSWHCAQHYESWLLAQGLFEMDNLSRPQLSAEGFAVLAMLAATRPFALAAKPIGLLSLARFAEIKPDSDSTTLQHAITEAEAALPSMPLRFGRIIIGGMPSVVLIGSAQTVLLQRETLWSLSFDDPYERDLLFLWMLERADRWEHWGAIVKANDARALTEHLLTLQLAKAPRAI